MLFTEFCVLHEANVTWLPQAVEHNGISPPRTSRSISALSVVHSTTRFAQFAVIVLALFCAMPAAIAAESVQTLACAKSFGVAATTGTTPT